MSGHSKWSQIKHKKGVADQKKGQLFSKLSKVISMAARRGTDTEMNIELKNAVEKAREANMPKENIERAIKRVADKNATQLEELAIEAVGPESLALIITAITDNKNRTIGEVKNILAEFGYKMGQQGAVMWMFDKKGQKFIPKYPLENLSENSKNSLEQILEKLEDNEDIQEVYENTGN